MRKEVLRFEHVEKSEDGERLLYDVNFSVYHSTIHCMIIPNTRSRVCFVDILRGASPADSGRIYISDKQVTHWSAKEVGCIYNKSSLVSHISISQNLFLTDKGFYRFGFIRRKLMTDTAAQILSEAGINHINPAQPAGLLNLYETRIVEIASAVEKGAQIICLDNIAEQYTDREMSDLGIFINHLNGKGITVIIVTRKYNALCDFAHSTTIIDNGSVVITLPNPLNRHNQILKHLNIKQSHVTERQRPSAPERVLRFVGQTSRHKDIDISVRRGEIVGLYDEDWFAADSVMYTLSGKVENSTKIYVNDTLVDDASLKNGIISSIAVIRNVRESNQLFSGMSLAQNITVSMGGPLYNRFGFRDYDVEKYAVRQMLMTLDSMYMLEKYGRYKSLPHLPRHEQMKIVVASKLCSNPSVLVFIDPLLSYDDITINEFYTMLAILKEQRYGILIISSSISELRRITDTVYNS